MKFTNQIFPAGPFFECQPVFRLDHATFQFFLDGRVAFCPKRQANGPIPITEQLKLLVDQRWHGKPFQIPDLHRLVQWRLGHQPGHFVEEVTDVWGSCGVFCHISFYPTATFAVVIPLRQERQDTSMVSPTDMRKLIGDNVSRIRKEQGLTQEQLSEPSELYRQFTSDLDRGKRNPTIVTIYEQAMAIKDGHLKLVSPRISRIRIIPQADIINRVHITPDDRPGADLLSI
jgi:DNA-binding XRE family transcriptional regulator